MFLHIDIDSFFASAERSVNDSLKHIPICVGSRSNLEIFNKKRTHIKLMNENSGAFVTPVFYSDKKKSFESYFVDEIEGRKKIRGIVTTASYEARKYGVKTAMPIAQALNLCPKMIVVPSNYPLYHKLSHKIHDFMLAHIPQVEQYSIDEFFGDVSGWVEDEKVYAFAKELQAKIYNHQNKIVSQNKYNATKRKKDKQVNEEVTKHNEKLGRQKNMERRQIVRFQEDLGIQRNNARKDYLQKGYKKDYVHRVQTEKQIIGAKEQEIMLMEKREGDLIKKLQNTQAVQKEAFQELENALKYQGTSPEKREEGEEEVNEV